MVTSSYNEQLEKLNKACKWAGVNKGRASQYQKLIREFFENNKRSKEHILALNESFEIINIWTYWQSVINEFPGLLPKIRDSLRKGPILREGENPKVQSTSNKPRNDAFVYLLAGKLIMQDHHLVCVDGIGKRGTACKDNSDLNH